MKDTPFEEPTPAGGQDDVRGERAARSYAGAKAGSEPEDGVNETDDMSAPETAGGGVAPASDPAFMLGCKPCVNAGYKLRQNLMRL